MFETTTQIRARYAETDRMGYVYYGNYLTYFEVARTEAIRALGLTYRRLEDELNMMLPVTEAKLNYKRPARYDDLLTLKTRVAEWPGVRIRFDTEVFDEAGNLLVSGYVALAFVNKTTMRPCRPPAVFLETLQNFWKPQN